MQNAMSDRENYMQSQGGYIIFPEKMAGVRGMLLKPLYPIYDQNLKFCLLYFWPDQNFETLWGPISYLVQTDVRDIVKQLKTIFFGATHTYIAHITEFATDLQWTIQEE